MTVPAVVDEAESASDEAEYVALLLGDNDAVSTPYVGCGCVPVLRVGQGEATPPPIPFARKELEP